MLTNDVDTTRCSAIKRWSDTIEVPKASCKILVPRLVFLSNCAINVLVNVLQLVNDWHWGNLRLSSSCASGFNHIFFCYKVCFYKDLNFYYIS